MDSQLDLAILLKGFAVYSIPVFVVIAAFGIARRTAKSKIRIAILIAILAGIYFLSRYDNDMVISMLPILMVFIPFAVLIAKLIKAIIEKSAKLARRHRQTKT